MYFVSVVASRLAIASVVFGLVLLFRRREPLNSIGTRSVEMNSIYLVRIGKLMAALCLAGLLSLACLWAIVHFGPLRPVHEWFS